MGRENANRSGEYELKKMRALPIKSPSEMKSDARVSIKLTLLSCSESNNSCRSEHHAQEADHMALIHF